MYKITFCFSNRMWGLDTENVEDGSFRKTLNKAGMDDFVIISLWNILFCEFFFNLVLSEIVLRFLTELVIQKKSTYVLICFFGLF